MIWPPPQFYARFKAIDNFDYQLRNGPEKHKTSVKFGTSDFIFMKKSQFGSWTDVPLVSFPPVDLSLASSLFSSSPPKGRQRFDSLKRNRSQSPGSEERSIENKAQKPDTATVDDQNDTSASQEKTEINNEIQIVSSISVSLDDPSLIKTPEKDENLFDPTTKIASGLSSISSDVGTFGPSASACPKSPSVNKHFTFGSKLPSFQPNQLSAAHKKLN